MKHRLFIKILLTYLAIIVVLLGTLDFYLTRFIERQEIDATAKSLREKADLIALEIKATNSPEATRQKLLEARAPAAARITWIRPDGLVLADTNANPAEMENHATRPEFIDALQGRPGQSIRFSHTLHIDFLYVAIPLEKGGNVVGALRLAYPLKDLQEQIRGIRARIWLSSLLAFFVAAGIGYFLSRSLVSRIAAATHFSESIAAGNFHHRMTVQGRDEISTLGDSLNSTADQLEKLFGSLDAERTKLHTVLESMLEGILVLDRQRKVILSNGAFDRLFNHPEPTKVGAPWFEALRHVELLSFFESLFTSGFTASQNFSLHSTPERFFQATLVPLKNSDGQIEMLVAVFYDTTEIERLERMRKDFVANVSHELRTPLTSIQGYIETLIEGAVDDVQRRGEFLDTIRQQAIRLGKLTADLLTLSTIEAGKYPFKRARTDLRQVILESLDAIRTLAQQKSISLLFEDRSPLTPVECDPDAIQQVLLNLLDNAVKFSPSGSTVRVEVERKEEMLAVSVLDQGIGIPSIELPRLFERFYRVDRARSRELGGTGLGLAIVKHIVEAHAGRVAVESQVGKGSRFTVLLPV